MLEINDFDQSRPADARTPDKAAPRQQVSVPGELLAQLVAAGASPNLVRQSPLMVPIEAPLAFSGFQDNVFHEFGPLFQQMGITAVQGGASSTAYVTKPAADWKTALKPGDAVAGVLVSGDMSVTGLGTVTYNDGKRVLAFGHPFFNLGPVDMPMSKGEVLMVLSSAVPAQQIRQRHRDRGRAAPGPPQRHHGRAGRESPMIPVTVTVRSLGENNAVRSEKDFRFNVFVSRSGRPT